MQNIDKTRQKYSSKSYYKQERKSQTSKIEIDTKNKKNSKEQKNLKNYLNISLIKKNKIQMVPQLIIDLHEGQYRSKMSDSVKIQKQIISEKLIYPNNTMGLCDIPMSSKHKNSNSFKNMTYNLKTTNFQQQLDLLKSQNDILRQQNKGLKRKIEKYQQILSFNTKQRQNDKRQHQEQKIQLENKYNKLKEKYEDMVIKVKNLYEDLIRQKRKNKEIRQFIIGFERSDKKEYSFEEPIFTRQSLFQNNVDKNSNENNMPDYYMSVRDRQKQRMIVKQYMEPEQEWSKKQYKFN